MMTAKDSGPLLWKDTPQLRIGPVARVVMAAVVEGQYTFTVPDELAAQVEPGKRLLVPFGRNRKPAPAFCVAVGREPWTATLKPVVGVLDDERLLSDALIELGQWMARYYCCPPGRTLAAMVPEPIRRQSGFRVVRTVHLARGRSEQDSWSAKRATVVEVMRMHPEGLDLETLIEHAHASKAIVSAMIKSGLLSVTTRREPMPAPNFDSPGTEPVFELNEEQRAAITRIEQATKDGVFKALLLFGVSGSGKTEVYIRAIRSVLAAGKQAILLVPEIALTTQIVTRLASRFRDVAVIHSGLTGVQRSLTFAALARGEKKVVIGTRSAVFAPCPNLGLIVVDEEQEASYKNQQSPRFNTRDVALKRAQMAHIPVVLGSATPSLETWCNCDRFSHFERIILPRRIAGLSMPRVSVVDMQFEQRQRKGVHLLSQEMEKQLGETLAAGQQAVLFLNRRGYATYLFCSQCKTPIVCLNCRVNMVFHQTTGKAICHHCQASMVVPKRCGDATCGGTLVRFGMGTQRLEEELRIKLPDARLARADSDTMRHVRDYEQTIERFTRREIDILIGTQMIAKGLDFPFVSFVGVINADTSLAVPDFRAAERTFQLVTQVAGRAGRAESSGTNGGPGVVVQSLSGLSPALQFAANHDFESFARHELVIRQRLHWPPYCRLARFLINHKMQSQASTMADALAERIREYLATQALSAEVLGPQPAPLSRLRNQYRFDFLLRAADAGQLMKILEQLRHADGLIPHSKNIQIDVDPVSLL
ncbi:MAG: primosomal protein N' [Phycisphaerales bacterium]|nr:primosomal protein N' [Phycisphaerales bacterium]